MLQRVQESPINRRHFVGGSDARVIMGQDEKALIRLWQEKRGNVAPAPTRRMGRNPANYLRPGFFTNCDLRKRTPAPPPLLSMNSIPAASNAWRSAASLASVTGISPSTTSARRIVATPTLEAVARSRALHRSSARAARI